MAAQSGSLPPLFRHANLDVLPLIKPSSEVGSLRSKSYKQLVPIFPNCAKACCRNQQISQSARTTQELLRQAPLSHRKPTATKCHQTSLNLPPESPLQISILQSSLGGMDTSRLIA